MARKKKDRGNEAPEGVAAAETGPGSPPEPSAGLKRITPVDIQHKEFRLAFRGYNERDVDAFLDEITEEIARLHAETKRLRDQVAEPGAARLQAAAPAEAEAVIQRARDEAARTVAEAQAKAAAIQAQARTAAAAGAGTGAGSPAAPPVALSAPKVPISAFLAREREFLQGLAGMIQSHADAVKEDVRKAREFIARASEPEPEPPADVPPAEAPASTSPDAEGATGASEPAGGSTGSIDAPDEAAGAAPLAAPDLSRADTMAFEVYPDEGPQETAAPETATTTWAQDPDEPWRPPVSQDAGGRAGEEGQGPPGDDEGSPWRSEAGSTFGPGDGVRPGGLVDLTAEERMAQVDAAPPADEPVDSDAEPGEPAVKPARAESVTARGASPEPDGGAEGEDRSLRELFWGQD